MTPGLCHTQSHSPHTHTNTHIHEQIHYATVYLSQEFECIHFVHIDNCGQHSEQKYKNENISRPNSFKGKKPPRKTTLNYLSYSVRTHTTVLENNTREN